MESFDQMLQRVFGKPAYNPPPMRFGPEQPRRDPDLTGEQVQAPAPQPVAPPPTVTPQPVAQAPTLQTLESALRKADAAGDTAGAKTLADEIRKMQTPTAPAPKDTTTGEKIAGFPLTRAVMGSPIPEVARALFRTPGTPIGESTVDKAMQEYEQSKRKGMEYWHEKTGGITAPATAPDWAGIFGLGGFTGKLAKGLKLPETWGGRVTQGAKVGGVTGLAEPVTAPKEDYVTQKAKQTGIGVAGGVVPSFALETLGGVGRFLKDIFQPIPKAANRLLTEYQRAEIGKANIPAVQKAAEAVQELVKGSKPTTAEAMVGVPEGTFVQAHQQQVAGAGRGVSVEFNKRLMEKEAAREAAGKATENLVAPIRDAALQGANAKGGVQTPKLLANLYDLSQQAGVKGNQVLLGALDSTREKIGRLAGASLRINANDLYASREELGKLAKNAYNANDLTTYGKIRDAQKLMDEAIEAAGGKGWKDYLDTYSRQLKLIEQDAERQANMYSPLQKTSIGGKEEISKGVREIPAVLEREVVIVNSIINMLRHELQPAINKEAARRYLNPKAFAEEIVKKPEAIDEEVWNALIQTSAVAGSALAEKTPNEVKARRAAQALGASPKP